MMMLATAGYIGRPYYRIASQTSVSEHVAGALMLMGLYLVSCAPQPDRICLCAPAALAAAQSA